MLALRLFVVEEKVVETSRADRNAPRERRAAPARPARRSPEAIAGRIVRWQARTRGAASAIVKEQPTSSTSSSS